MGLDSVHQIVKRAGPSSSHNYSIEVIYLAKKVVGVNIGKDMLHIAVRNGEKSKLLSL